MAHYPLPLIRLIESFRKLPGVGFKTAERYAFDLVTQKPEKAQEMIESIQKARQQLATCPECGALKDQSQCTFCDISAREQQQLCIVAYARDLYVIENTREYRGLYHVLGGLISPMQGYHAEHLFIENLVSRINKNGVKEVILALDATTEGDATAFYIKQILEHTPINLSRLAFGLPLGSSFDYIDGGTLARAISGRNTFL